MRGPSSERPRQRSLFGTSRENAKTVAETRPRLPKWQDEDEHTAGLHLGLGNALHVRARALGLPFDVRNLIVLADGDAPIEGGSV
jgi:hypothetical protein